MRRPTLKCPFCGSILPNREYKARRPLTCPGCSERLRLSRWYLHLNSLIALVLALLLCLFFGLRGLWLFLAVVLMWFPVAVVWDFLFGRIFSPKFERYPSSSDASNSGTSLFPR